ncbi:MAG: zinc protease, partial [Planctomycetota bacterium]
MKRILVLFAAGALLVSCASTPKSTTVSNASDPLAQVLAADPQVSTGTLANGFRYVIRKNTKPENRAELRLVVNVGSVLEDADQQGLAHFAEHMAFNGTKNFEKQELVDYLEGIGMRFGPDLNAYTSFDETVYMLQVPMDSTEVIETAFQILEDWAHQVSFEPEEIDKERGVVVEEWRLGRGANRRMFDEQLPILLKDSRYAERLPIGQKAVLDTFKHASLLRFYKTWYRPDLMGFVAVGDFEPAYMESLTKVYFSRLAQAQEPREREVFPVPGHEETLFAIASDPEASNNVVSIYTKQDVRDQSTAG